MKKLTVCMLLVAMLMLPAISFGATATGTAYVYAQVLAGGTCTVYDMWLSFGTLSPPIVANVDTSTGTGIICPDATPYSITLSAGNSGNQLSRRMVEPTTSAQMSYNIYTDFAYTTIWGDGTGGTGVQTGTGNGSSQTIMAYGRVPAQPDPTAGNFSDTLTITVTY